MPIGVPKWARKRLRDYLSGYRRLEWDREDIEEWFSREMKALTPGSNDALGVESQFSFEMSNLYSAERVVFTRAIV